MYWILWSLHGYFDPQLEKIKYTVYLRDQMPEIPKSSLNLVQIIRYFHFKMWSTLGIGLCILNFHIACGVQSVLFLNKHSLFAWNCLILKESEVRWTPCCTEVRFMLNTHTGAQKLWISTLNISSKSLAIISFQNM